ncbi:MAG: tRNA lysidine(34) synthetase TilS [Hyphomicrobiales bacterium]|nr:tRNA lysidine(34) synthetase TilS [Hyphomicrobiales bacterium]
MPAASAPIGAAEANRLFAALSASPRLAVAVSGGADSTALMLLLARWKKTGAGGPELSVFTVDHGLRAGSRKEAESVGEWALALGLAHEILTWRGDKPKSNIQAAARAARYRLLAEACHRDGIAALVSAHHRDDQAETFLMRLARGSGVDGLSAMDAVSEMMGITLFRPLLDVPRARLKATLKAAGQDWIEDPGNEDKRFARVRMRAVLERLAEEGVSAERLAATARHMRRARLALEAATDDLARAAARLEPAGFCTIDREALSAAPAEIALRLLARALMAVAGKPYRPRLERLERLFSGLKETDRGRWTLAGCRIAASREEVLIWREAGRAGLPEISLDPGKSALWDGRFHVEIAAEEAGPVAVRALGEEGWREVAGLCGEKPGLPAHIGRTCISFWRNGKIVAAPHIVAVARPQAAFRATFIGSILSRGESLAPLVTGST